MSPEPYHSRSVHGRQATDPLMPLQYERSCNLAPVPTHLVHLVVYVWCMILVHILLVLTSRARGHIFPQHSLLLHAPISPHSQVLPAAGRGRGGGGGGPPPTCGPAHPLPGAAAGAVHAATRLPVCSHGRGLSTNSRFSCVSLCWPILLWYLTAVAKGVLHMINRLQVVMF